MTDDTWDAADALDEAARRAAEQEAEDWRLVAGTPSGRRILWQLMERFGLISSCFAGENTHATAHAEGRREAALYVYQYVIAHAPGAFLMMLEEQRSTHV